MVGCKHSWEDTMKALLSGCLAVAVGFAAGCGIRTAEEVEQALQASDRLLQEGQVDAALASLDRSYRRARAPELKIPLLGALLRYTCDAGRVDDARRRFGQVALADAAVAEPFIKVMAGAIAAKGQPGAVAGWCQELREARWSDSALVLLATLHLNDLIQGGQAADVEPALKGYLAALTDAGAVQVLGQGAGAAIQAQAWGAAGGMLEQARQCLKASPERDALLVNLTVDLLTGRDGWKAAQAWLLESLPELADDVAARNVSVVGNAGLATGACEEVEAMCRTVFLKSAGRPAVIESAGDLWLRCAEAREGIAEWVGRLRELKLKGARTGYLVGRISRHYSRLLDQGDTPSHRATLDLCQALEADAAASDKPILCGFLLDLSYFVKDYDSAIAILGRKEMGMDNDQKAKLTAKIKAHQAMDLKQYREAIGFFREFMTLSRGRPVVELDPVDNTKVTGDMILGLNARRIGDLWMAAGDAAEARKAYAESLGYYEAALKEFPDPKSPEHVKIVKAMSGIPKG